MVSGGKKQKSHLVIMKYIPHPGKPTNISFAPLKCSPPWMLRICFPLLDVGGRALWDNTPHLEHQSRELGQMQLVNLPEILKNLKSLC